MNPKVLFYLLLILLPSQLGRHFWPEFAFVSGVRVDYLSPTLYVTDLVILSMAILEIFNLALRSFRAQFPIFKQFSIKKVSILAGLGVFAVLNIQTSLSPAVSAYKWLKVLEMGFLVYWIARNKINIRTITKLLLIPVFFEAVLIFWQFWNQSTIGGFWWFLGERTINPGTLGAANTIISGQLWLRPYGTFAHPNVAAGFLAVILPLILYYFPHNNRIYNALVKFGKMGILGLGFAALFLTMSRSSILVGVFAISVVLVIRYKVKYVWPIWLVGGLFLLAIFRTGNESFVVRESMNALAMQNFSHSPLLGTGLGTTPAFGIEKISNFALWHQPTHNIYLLLLAETGLIGLIGLVVLGLAAVGRSFRDKKWILGLSVFEIGMLGFFDHYFLTLQQGQLLLALVLGLVFQEKNKPSRIGE